MRRFAGIPTHGLYKNSLDPLAQMTQVWHISWRWSVQNLITLDQPLAQLTEVCKKVSTLTSKHWIFQLEDTEKNLHFQGYWNLHKKVRAKTLAINLNKYMPGIECQPSSNAGKEALQNYVMKEESRKDGPWSDKPFQHKQTGWDIITKLHPWQLQIENEIKHKCKNTRTINWLFDPLGGTGKTSLIKMLYKTYDIGWLYYANTRDLLNYVFKTSNKNCYIFNLTKAKPRDIGGEDLYSALESIKDGMIFNGKYETGTKCMDPPHIWVFANEKPNYSAMTNNRFKVWTIENNQLSTNS